MLPLVSEATSLTNCEKPGCTRTSSNTVNDGGFILDFCAEHTMQYVAQSQDGAALNRAMTTEAQSARRALIDRPRTTLAKLAAGPLGDPDSSSRLI